MAETVKEICVKAKKNELQLLQKSCIHPGSVGVDTPICECGFKVKSFSNKLFFRFQKKNKVGKMCGKKRLLQQLHQSP